MEIEEDQTDNEKLQKYMEKFTKPNPMQLILERR